MLNATSEAAALQQFECVGAFIDTIELHAKSLDCEAMSALCQDVGVKILFPETFDEHGQFQGRRVVIHQPPKDKFKVIAAFQKKHAATLSRFDVAIDFADRPGLLEFLKQHLTMKWCPAGWQLDVETTAYAVDQNNRTRRSSRNLAIYPTFSKLDGQQCVHIELRFQRTSAARREGYANVNQLLALDPAKLFRKHVRLIEQFDAQPHVTRHVRHQVKQRHKRHHQSKHRYHPVSDQYLANFAKRLQAFYRRIHIERAQHFAQFFPRQYSRLKGVPLTQLDLPDRLSWVR